MHNNHYWNSRRNDPYYVSLWIFMGPVDDRFQDYNANAPPPLRFSATVGELQFLQDVQKARTLNSGGKGIG
jgi:hypothetical protein